MDSIHFRVTVTALWMLLMFCGVSSGIAAENSLGKSDTMLMFVGESLDILTIASRREETAWQAPAVADVITRKNFREAGMTTIGEALSLLPGFHMAQKEWGITPYLRGTPNSILFQMDTVPFGSDVSKSLNFLDGEISLAGIKRIEVIRGSGSVLWGPDAFAGIVNVVPMTGKDLNGVETGIGYGDNGDQKSAYVNMGYDTALWDLFASISGKKEEKDNTLCNIVGFWQDDATPLPPEERMGMTTPGESDYKEAYVRGAYRDWLTLSGRVSEYNRPYRILGDDGLLSWREERNVSNGFIKFEADKTLGVSSALRLMWSYTWLEPEQVIIDKVISQKEDAVYGEAIYDLSVFSGAGLITGGISYREKHVRDAPVWDGYLYDFLSPENDLFVPGLTSRDYDNTLWSYFGQVRHKIGAFDFLAGIRYDNHDPYKDNISFNLGTIWAPNRNWILKMLYGSAYRTPFALQLRSDESPDLEQIKSTSIQLAWKGIDELSASVSLFNNRIEKHVMEDSYAGLSQPNHQEINGIEIETRVQPWQTVELKANLTLMENSGPAETYKFNDYSFPLADGTVERHFVDIVYPYDMGPQNLFNLSMTWRPHERVTLFSRLRYSSDTSLVYPRNETPRSFSDTWTLDATLTLGNILNTGVDCVLTIKNVADREYDIPGTYNSLDGDPFLALFEIRKKW